MASNNQLDATIGEVHEPTLQNPTWNYLHNNFKKTELQKRCRELGLTKIWVTKEKLIDMIMEKTPTVPRNERTNAIEQVSSSEMKKVIKDVNMIKEKLYKKENEIQELKAKLENAVSTIESLQGRVLTLENEVT